MDQSRQMRGLRWALRFMRSIRFRLMIWYVLILALVLLLFGAIVYVLLARALQSEQDSQLTERADQLIASYDPQDNQFHVGADLQNMIREGKVVALLLDPRGDIVQSFAPIPDANVARLAAVATTAPDSRRTFRTVTINLTLRDGGATADYRIYTTPIQDRDQVVGTLVLARPRQDATTLRIFVLALLAAVPMTLLLAAAGGAWLAAHAMRPVQTITRTARAIGETDLSRRLRLRGDDEIGELAATFDQMLDQLEAAFVRQRQFTSDASHELRTPLTIVNLELSRALARRRTPEEYELALAIIQAENAQMTRLVSDLLTLARADAGQAALDVEPLDLSDVALEVVERLAPLVRQRHVGLAIGALPELPIAGSRLYLTQMLANLVENAIKFTAGTGDRVCVDTGSRQIDGMAWVRVADNGPGIAAEHLPQLFDRFYQVDKAHTGEPGRGLDRDHTDGGSGLGLAIAQWVAEAHGGAVQVRSAAGQGTVFEVWLPCTR